MILYSCTSMRRQHNGTSVQCIHDQQRRLLERFSIRSHKLQVATTKTSNGRPRARFHDKTATTRRQDNRVFRSTCVCLRQMHTNQQQEIPNGSSRFGLHTRGQPRRPRGLLHTVRPTLRGSHIVRRHTLILYRSRDALRMLRCTGGT